MNGDDAQTGIFLLFLGCFLVGLIIGYVVGHHEQRDRVREYEDPADWWKRNSDEERTWYGKP